ncbi:Rv1476 family membrane protein [Mycobacterium bourgelatii]|uniref:Uncharacterized protein n=1 Tax=Mycobacterium bourgelatii TaxID=1273442 RepID=A0A7I9YND9_MYCBU|nr:DUF6676 family protein [Mycobacterium bourgelatii]MCV6974110.1 hypothetical protein [Mycobacterium bourgelatii]GFG90190.1 hypothetical protein MBOU_22320 [Mycobacterium bourgelatii]
MTGQGPQTIPFLPAYIPEDVNMDAIKAEVAASGVSAPPEAKPGLLEVLHRAQDEHINLKIVLLDHNPPNDTPLRDISTVVGADYPDSTVLTLSPSYVGSYSSVFPRVTLEAGEDHSKTGNPVQSAQNFLNGLNTPEFPWDVLTIVLLIGVFAAAFGARFIQRRSVQPATSTATSRQLAEEPTQGV